LHFPVHFLFEIRYITHFFDFYLAKRRHSLASQHTTNFTTSVEMTYNKELDSCDNTVSFFFDNGIVSVRK